MMMQSIGDLARGLVLERQTTRLKSDLERLSGALASGRIADAARHLGGNTAPLMAIETAIARGEARRTALGELAQRAEVVQTVIAGLDTVAAPLRASALGAGPMPSEGQLALVAEDALGRLRDAVSLVNTRDAGRAVLGGAETGRNPLAPASAILDGLRSALGPTALLPAESVAAAVRAWFDAPAGFAAVAWQGDTRPAGPVAAGGEAGVALEANALDPAIRRTLEGLALAVLAGEVGDRGGPLLGHAGAALGEAADQRALLAGRIGSLEAQVDRASARIAAETNALSIRRNTMTTVDPFESATALARLQDQLETVYAVTARLARLSLADFLR